MEPLAPTRGIGGAPLLKGGSLLNHGPAPPRLMRHLATTNRVHDQWPPIQLVYSRHSRNRPTVCEAHSQYGASPVLGRSCDYNRDTKQPISRRSERPWPAFPIAPVKGSLGRS